MIRNIIHTIGSRLMMAIISIALLLLNANFLGAEGVGTIGLLVLGISLFVLVSNLINGSGLVFFSNRYPIILMGSIAYLWILLLVFICYLGIHFFPEFQQKYGTDLVLLSFILSVATTHSSLLLGKEAVRKFNICHIAQSIAHFAAVLFFYFVLDDKSVASFIKAIYVAYSVHLILSFYFIIPYVSAYQKQSVWKIFKSLLHYGFYVQWSNIFQMLNYRFSYYLLQIFSGTSTVGIYSAGVQLSEGLLLPSRSIAIVQYARIANLPSTIQAAQLTLSLVKVAFFITLPLLVFILIIPAPWFVFFLGKDFESVKTVILLMGTGILALSAESVFSRFFSGTGKQHINTLSSGIGFSINLIFGLLLIPKYGAYGAAATASITYLSMLIFIFIQMKKNIDINWQTFVFNKNDLELIKAYFQKK